MKYTRTIKNSPKTGKITLKEAQTAARKATDRLVASRSSRNAVRPVKSKPNPAAK